MGNMLEFWRCFVLFISAFLLYSSSHTQGSFNGKLYVGCHRCQWLLPILSVKMVQMLCHSTTNHLLVLDHAGIESIDSFASVTTPNNREFEARHSHSIPESDSEYHGQGLDFPNSQEWPPIILAYTKIGRAHV